MLPKKLGKKFQRNPFEEKVLKKSISRRYNTSRNLNSSPDSSRMSPVKMCFFRFSREKYLVTNSNFLSKKIQHEHLCALLREYKIFLRSFLHYLFSNLKKNAIFGKCTKKNFFTQALRNSPTNVSFF